MRSFILFVGVVVCVFQGQLAQAQVVRVAPLVTVHHRGTTIQSAYNDSMARRELAAGRRDYYEALAERARARATRDLVEARTLALRSLQVEASAEYDGAAVLWPTPFDQERFAADREAANQVLLTWTASPNGVRNVDKQRLRTSLVRLRMKLKRSPAVVPPADNKVADEFLNGVAHTVLGPRATLD
jgi:hypothetical protein